jgi:YidC/Oxa1 family membrane protein insertase
VLNRGDRIVVATDVLRAEIDTHGGDLRRVELLGVPVSKDRPDQNLFLLNDELPNFFIMQSGLIDASETAPNHRTLFRAEPVASLPNAEISEVRLRWDDAGREVVKVYQFKRGSYEVKLQQLVTNHGASAWVVSPYVQLWRTPYTDSEDPPFIQTFMGVAWYQQKNGGDKYSYEKSDFEDLSEEPLALQQIGGWNAMLQHYFMAAVIPPADASGRLFAKPRPLPGSALPGYVAGYVGPQQSVPAGGSVTLESRQFIGPKLQNQLGDIAPGLDLAVDYGMLTIIAEPLFWVLAWLHKLTGNWGWAIVLLTVVIKGAFYKLSEHQYRAMAHMKHFAPRIQAMKERYADDREGLHKAMMDLYKKEGFNPLGGCWPLLVQFPVFIALYWVLLESVELRQAPFVLWIQDMSSPDPWFVLPVIFGITMFIQQKLSGSMATMEEMQQKIMMAMPIMLTVFFAFFPAGLVLYWLVSNILGIAQQWYITRKLEREEAAKA